MTGVLRCERSDIEEMLVYFNACIGRGGWVGGLQPGMLLSLHFIVRHFFCYVHG